MPVLEGLEDRAVPAVLSAFLTTEHVDLNVSYTGGANGTWSLQPRDADHAVAYSPEDALLYVGDNAQSRVARPSDPAFDFIGVGAGEPFYRAPQNQNPELIYLGVAGYGVTPSLFDRYNPLAESKGRVSGTGAWVKVSLVDVKHFTPEGQPGQGQFSVWQSGENGPNVLMSTVNDGVNNPNSAGLDTTDGIGADDALWIIAGGHIHYNWGFSEKGRYEVEFKLSGYLNDGNTTELGQAVESEPIKLYFSVGSVGELEFDASSYTVNESAGTASLTVRRIGGSDGRISVEYATSDGTATAGSDYSETKGVLTFNDQETVKTITIPIINDTLVEGDETVQLTLTKPAPTSINGYLIDFESDDNGLLGSQTTATLTILDDDTTSNSPPTLSDIADQTILEDEATGAIAFTVGDAQTAPGDLIVTAASSNGTLVPVDGIVLGGSGANRTITIRPAANQSGSTTITLTVTDAGGLTATDTFVLTVTPVNDAPVANPLSVVTDEDTAKAITLSGVDIEDDPLGYIIVDGPIHGTLTGAGASLTYTPSPNYHGPDSFTYKVNDGRIDSEIVRVEITVNAVNDAPVANARTVSVDGGKATEIILTGSDIDSDSLTYVIVSGPSHGTLTGTAPQLTYRPAAGYSGPDSFTFKVNDGSLDSPIATVQVTVDAAPVISSINDQFVVENGTTGPISFTVGDALTPAADLVVTVTSSNSALVPNGNIVLGGGDAARTLAITPIAGQVGSTTITITVTDAAGLQTSEAFVLTVTANRLVPFAMPTYHGGALTSYAWNSVAADFNGDGYVDVITSSGSLPLVYYQGTGDGRFLPEQSLNAGLGLSAEGIAAVDYDGDGDADLLAFELNEATSDRTISLYRNDGTGQFTRVVLKSGLRSGYTLEVGDFNEDGRPDVAYNTSLYDPATNTQTLAFNYALQQPTGELGPETTLWTANGYGDLAVGDVNGDGHLDIVGAETIYAPDFSSSTNRLLIFPGGGDGTFGSPQAITTGVSPTVQQIVDVNGDGRLDLIVSDRVGDSRAGYYPQQADGSLGARVGLLPGIGQLNALRVADINGDGVPDLVSDTYSGDYGSLSVSWSPGLGGGAFGAAILIAPNDSNMTSFQVADLDGDSYPDIVATSYASGSLKQPVRVFLNKTGEDPMVLLPPAARGYVAGDPIDLQVYFGFPITVNGTPRIALRVGENLVYADYVGGSGTPTLRFRYTVSSTDVDLDGVQLASDVIDLNGGTLKNPINGDSVLTFPNLTFNGVVVNGAGPLVQMISRLDATPTEAGTVRFAVQFAEDVTGVDVTDFAVRMNAGDLAGAAVLSVTGSGGLYEVTVSTGTGSGTLGLSVLGTASIHDLDGSILGKGYEGGQVYTVRTTPLGDIDKLYTDGHADYRPVYEDGEFSYVLNDGESAIPSDEVITYFDSTALVNRPESGTYDFLGVGPGEQYYLSNSNGSVATVPYLGWSGESLARGSFATYRPDDPRITSNTPQGYLKVQLVGMRSSSGGDFSLYSIANESPRVWMATSDGISDTDNIWLYPGTHLHRNTAFSKPGTYEIDIVVSGFLDSNGNGVYDPIVDTYVESGIQTMVFHVDTLGARDDAYTVHGRNPLHGSVTMNDEWHDALGDMTASVVTTTTKGSLVLQPNGSFSYVPSEAFDGTDSFVYQLTNSRGGLTTATVIITAAGPRDFEAIVTEGHTDVGIGYEDEAWDLHVHDEEHDAEYEPGKALLYVGPQALTSRTGGLAGPAFDFLGAAAGETFYSLPQTPNPELLFLGIGAEELGTGVFSGDEVTLRLKAVNGPGHFSLWQSGDLGPTVAMATSDGITLADQAVIQAGSHGHYHWSFTARGRYEVTFEALATLPDGTAVASGDVTYYFSVDSLGQIQLDSPTYSMSEDGVVTVTVLRTGGSDGPVTVEYAAVGGTATSGVDFASFGGTLTFLDGETEKTFTIVSLPDTIAEGDETVIVSLFAPEGSPTRLGSPSDAILTIVDDDPPIPADGVISGYVFIDSLNHNGLRDPGEAGVAGVRLTLTGFDDLGPIEPRSVVTGADGSYRFEGLRPGTYHVAEEQPDGLLDGKDSRGPSHVLEGSQRTDVIDGVTLAPSEQVEAINFGELQAGRIGGSVFEDVDGNGLRRNGEQGIAGVVITLTGTDDLGAITPRTIQTSADGTYVFDGLRPGVYTITEIQPDGFHDGWNTRDNLVVLPGSAGVDTIPVTLSPGQSLVENHFGEVRRTKGDDSVSEPATTVIARVVNRRTIALFFNSPLDAAQASTLAHYRLSAVGQFGQSVSRNIRTVPLRVATYNPEFHFVRLAIPPRMRLRNNLTYQLDVNRQVALNPSEGLVSEDGTLGDYSVRFTRGRSVSSFDVDGDRAQFTTRSRNMLELHGTSSGAASRLYVQPAPRQSGGQLEASVTPGLASDGLFNLPLLDGVERFRSNPVGRLTIGQVVPRGPIPPRIR